jgi:WXG100 family type VII secretion target
MAGQIKVNTDQVAQIATSIENLNKKLTEELTTGQTTIKNLANTWEGEASQSTINSFNAFATKYFQHYYDVIDNYVKFLRNNVDAGYFETETTNNTLADAFK